MPTPAPELANLAAMVIQTSSDSPTASTGSGVAGAARRVEGGVDETRSLQRTGGRRAPGWSPAAAEQRTRAAWSNDPSLGPAPRARASSPEPE